MWPTYLVVFSTILALGCAQKITTTNDVSLPSPTMRPRRCRGRSRDERNVFGVAVGPCDSSLGLSSSPHRAGEVSESSIRYAELRTNDTSAGRTDDLRDRDHGRQRCSDHDDPIDSDVGSDHDDTIDRNVGNTDRNVRGSLFPSPNSCLRAVWMWALARETRRSCLRTNTKIVGPLGRPPASTSTPSTTTGFTASPTITAVTISIPAGTWVSTSIQVHPPTAAPSIPVQSIPQVFPLPLRFLLHRLRSRRFSSPSPPHSHF
jgi:hypothetical protein